MQNNNPTSLKALDVSPVLQGCTHREAALIAALAPMAHTARWAGSARPALLTLTRGQARRWRAACAWQAIYRTGLYVQPVHLASIQPAPVKARSGRVNLAHTAGGGPAQLANQGRMPTRKNSAFVARARQARLDLLLALQPAQTVAEGAFQA
jgi:hypothetical protein